MIQCVKSVSKMDEIKSALFVSKKGLIILSKSIALHLRSFSPGPEISIPAERFMRVSTCTCRSDH